MLIDGPNGKGHFNRTNSHPYGIVEQYAVGGTGPQIHAAFIHFKTYSQKCGTPVGGAHRHTHICSVLVRSGTQISFFFQVLFVIYIDMAMDPAAAAPAPAHHFGTYIYVCVSSNMQLTLMKPAAVSFLHIHAAVCILSPRNQVNAIQQLFIAYPLNRQQQQNYRSFRKLRKIIKKKPQTENVLSSLDYYYMPDIVDVALLHLRLLQLVLFGNGVFVFAFIFALCYSFRPISTLGLILFSY